MSVAARLAQSARRSARVGAPRALRGEPAILREAVRLVEHGEAQMRLGLASWTRRQPRPNIDRCCNSSPSSSAGLDLGVDQVFGTHIVLEEFAMTLAPRELGRVRYRRSAP